MTKYRLYNAGNKIVEKIAVDNPLGHDNACKSFYNLDIPGQSFFELPSEFAVAGHAVPVNFLKEVLERYGVRQIVQVDPLATDLNEAEPIATNDADAKKKAEGIWRNYLRGVVELHLKLCQEIRTRGGAPIEAAGFTKYALEQLGIADPGVNVVLGATASPEMSEMKKRMDEQQALIDKLLALQPKTEPVKTAKG